MDNTCTVAILVTTLAYSSVAPYRAISRPVSIRTHPYLLPLAYTDRKIPKTKHCPEVTSPHRRMRAQTLTRNPSPSLPLVPRPLRHRHLAPPRIRTAIVIVIAIATATASHHRAQDQVVPLHHRRHPMMMMTTMEAPKKVQRHPRERQHHHQERPHQERRRKGGRDRPGEDRGHKRSHRSHRLGRIQFPKEAATTVPLVQACPARK